MPISFNLLILIQDRDWELDTTPLAFLKNRFVLNKTPEEVLHAVQLGRDT
jgi:hypothetical protein